MNEPKLVREQPRPSPGLTSTKWLHKKLPPAAALLLPAGMPWNQGLSEVSTEMTVLGPGH